MTNARTIIESDPIELIASTALLFIGKLHHAGAADELGYLLRLSMPEAAAALHAGLTKTFAYTAATPTATPTEEPKP